MLKDLGREDWLSLLKIPEGRVPKALVLRGTRNLKLHYQAHQGYFMDILEVGSPNGVLEDVFIGDLGGISVAYASVYGAPMASEVTHVFGVLGTRLVVQTGCCGALAEEIAAGDLFIAQEALCGEGASQYYRPGEKVLGASIDLREWMPAMGSNPVGLYSGRIYTTSALFAEGLEEVEAWFQAGCSAVDMETAATYAVAKYFGMERASVLYAFDNPRQKEHILLEDSEKDERRAAGNQAMIELVLEVIRRFPYT